MSKHIEDLTEDIRSLGVTVVSGPPVDLSAPLAQHLRNLGYRKPRTISTVEELDALPVGSVVITKLSEVISKRSEPDGELQSWWAMAGTSEYFQSKELPFPATVLHEGKTNV